MSSRKVLHLFVVPLVWLILAAAVPALAEGDAPVAPTVAPTTSTSCAGEAQALPEGFVPEPDEAGACSAQQWCPNGCYISCSGSNSCSVGATSVTCDGVTTQCPYPSCTPPGTCLAPCGFCQCKAMGWGGCLKNYCVDWEPPYP